MVDNFPPYRGRGNNSKHGHKPPVRLEYADVVPKYLDGMKCREVATSLGVSDETIRRALDWWGVPRRKRGAGGMRKEENPFYRGGRPKYRSNKYWAAKIATYCYGRALPRGAVVHHVDGNPQNNDPTNLILFLSHTIHQQVHYLLSRLPQPVDRVEAIRVALENGGQALQRPPALEGWKLDTSPPVPLENQPMRMPDPPGFQWGKRIYAPRSARRR